MKVSGVVAFMDSKAVEGMVEVAKAAEKGVE